MASIESLLRTDFKPVDKRDEIRTVLGWLTGDSTKLPIVVDDGRPFGIVNERALMSRRLDQKAKVENFTLTTRALGLAATPEAAGERMREFRAAYLPIEDKRGKVAGYVTALDVARHVLSERLASDLALPVRMLTEQDSLGEALHAFTQEYVGFLPVRNGGGKVTGVVPRREILKMELGAGHQRGRKDAGGEPVHILKDPVSGFMDATPIFVPSLTKLDALLDAVESHGYAIVQDRGNVVGMVTPETLMRTGAGIR